MVVKRPDAKRTIEELLRRFKQLYGDRTIALRFSNPLELLVATILSAQTNDETVNRVTEKLFQKYRTAADYANAPEGELEQDLRSINYYRNKAKAIRACCQMLLKEFGGQVPDSMEALLRLPGIGRKTANVILSFGFGKNEGVVVDTHVARVARRLGLTSAEKPEDIEQDLMKLVPQDLWDDLGNWLIWHGRLRCKAKNPACQQCELADLCPSAGLDASNDQSDASKRRTTRRRKKG